MSTDSDFASGIALHHGYTAGDDGWDTGMESNLRKLNMLVQVAVVAIQNAAPVSPSNGDMYVVGTAGSGAFSGHSKAVAAYYDTTWYFFVPYEGVKVFNKTDHKTYTYNASGAWAAADSGLTDAPIDGSQYARQDGNWTIAGGGLADAVGNLTYGRHLGNWTIVTEEAPEDGTSYVRKDGGWVSEAGGGGGGNVTESIVIAIGDESTAITTGTAKVTFRMPYALTVDDVRASLTTASSSGNVTVDINEAGTTILSTKLSIDASEKTSTTAATAVVISDTTVADDAEMTIDIDAAGTGAAGLKVTIIGHQ